MPTPECPKCKHNEFIPIPDSLAQFCKNCGFVWVGTSGNYRPGKTIFEWAEDLAEGLKNKEKE